MPMTPIHAAQGKKLDWIINNWAEHRTLEPIECADGHIVSVQADGGHYCHDANGVDDRWRTEDQPLALPVRSVEVMTKDAPADWDEKDIEGPGAGSEMYGWVPVDEVRAFIDSHGGEKGAGTPTQLDRIEALLERIAQNTAPQSFTIDHRSLADAVRRGIPTMKEIA